MLKKLAADLEVSQRQVPARRGAGAGVSELDVSRIPAGHIRTLARYAATTWASVIARMPAARRTATLVAFARVFDATGQDDALDVLDLMMGTLLARVENESDQARPRTIRDLDAAALRLRDVG